MSNSARIHWLGAGLSSWPGIVSLVTERPVTVWNRTVTKAQAIRQHLPDLANYDVQLLDLDSLAAQVGAGDVVVSMLPGTFHVDIAKLALQKGAHMVTTSYITPEMQALDEEARQAGLCVINECGVDPGIDHLFAELLVDAARQAGVLGTERRIDFVSYCGGVPAVANDFRYKFSWAPAGVLGALKNQARSIRDGSEHVTKKAWTDVDNIEVLGEDFEVYPNRDSLPYVAAYQLDGVANLRTFVRGTLRLGGWKEAWSEIFAQVETATPEQIKALGDALWSQYPYADGEQDRVILYVALHADTDNGERWHASLSLDEQGSGWQSAMARTVSLTAACAIRAVLDGRAAPGVQMAAANTAEARRWLTELQAEGLHLRTENVAI